MKKSRLALLLAAVMSISLLVGCGAPKPESAPQADSESASVAEPADEPEVLPDVAPTETFDELIVGLDDTFAPMGFRDEGGNLVGFDIDLANAVGEEMGVAIKFQPINWDAKEMELETRKIDCVWNGMSRNPEREASMTLSQDYLTNKLAIVSTADVTITALEQLADYKLGTQVESSALAVVQASDVYPSIKENLSEYPTYDEVILDMQAGRIQVMIVDEVLWQYKENNLNTKFNVSSVDFGEDFYTIGFRKDDAELCAKVEAAIKAIKESGKGTEISEKWFGSDRLLEMK